MFVVARVRGKLVIDNNWKEWLILLAVNVAGAAIYGIIVFFACGGHL